MKRTPTITWTSVLVLVAACVTLASCALYWTSLREAQDEELTAAQRRVELRAAQLEEASAQQLDAVVRSVDITLQHLGGVHFAERRDCEQVARAMLALYPAGMLESISVYGANGAVTCSTSPAERPAIADREEFQVHTQAKSDDLFIGRPVPGELLIPLTRRIWQGGRMLGVAGATLRPEYLSERLGPLRVDPTDTLSIVRTDGTFIARSVHMTVALGTRVPADRPFLSARPGDRGQFRSVSVVDRRPLLFSWRRLAAWPLVAVAAVNEEAELAPLVQQQTLERERTAATTGLLLLFASGLGLLAVQFQRKNAALTESESRYRATLEASPVPMALVDPEQRVVLLNSAFSSTFGFEMHEIPTVADWWPLAFPDPDYRKQVSEGWQSHVERVRRADAPVDPMEVRVHTREGDERTVLASATYLGRTPDSLQLVTLFDISARVRADAAADKAHRLLQEAIRNVALGFTIYDENDRLVDCNEAYLSIYSTSRDLIVPGRSFEDIVRRGAERGQYREAVGRVDEWVRQRVQTHQRADGTLVEQELDDGRWLLIVENRTPSGFIVGNRIDITQRKRAEAQLEEFRQHLEALVDERTLALSIAKEAAEAADRAKTAFLANMSHELRTPLNVIIGMTAMALRRATDERQIEQLQSVSRASQGLNTVISDVLDISRIEAERLTLDQVEFRLGSVLENLGRLIGPGAAKKGLALDISMPPELSAQRVRGDPVRLGQVLLNLGSNAIKFTPAGSVTVGAVLVQEEPDHLVVRFDVTDTGIGIAAENLERMFHSFTQADGSLTREFGGAGLGLAISRRLAELMGGQMAARSKPGQGSCFWFSTRLEAVGWRDDDGACAEGHAAGGIAGTPAAAQG